MDHGGGTKVAVEAAKKRYVLWCLCGEPCLNPTFFNVIVGMWVQKLNDQIIEMPLSLQMRLLETTLEILQELNYVAANYVEVDSPDEK